jgi:hypothetical protein
MRHSTPLQLFPHNIPRNKPIAMPHRCNSKKSKCYSKKNNCNSKTCNGHVATCNRNFKTCHRKTLSKDPQKTLNRHPQKTLNRHPQKTLNRHPRKTLDRHPRKTLNRHPQKTLDRHPAKPAGLGPVWGWGGPLVLFLLGFFGGGFWVLERKSKTNHKKTQIKNRKLGRGFWFVSARNCRGTDNRQLKPCLILG